MRTTPARTRSAKAPSSTASAPPTTFVSVDVIAFSKLGISTKYEVRSTNRTRCGPYFVLRTSYFLLLRFARRHAQLGRLTAAQDADRDRLPDVLGGEAAAQIVEALDRLARELDDDVADRQARVRRRAAIFNRHQ